MLSEWLHYSYYRCVSGRALHAKVTTFHYRERKFRALGFWTRIKMTSRHCHQGMSPQSVRCLPRCLTQWSARPAPSSSSQGRLTVERVAQHGLAASPPGSFKGFKASPMEYALPFHPPHPTSSLCLEQPPLLICYLPHVISFPLQ